ncbi:TPA: hypothetical protein PXO62_000063 [Yersinia enterocolitica]|nr:hypothetical protein [Yersinia enterocolitica]HDL7594173.1 hypothetical protein [Yersinia enterocolitica]
MEFILGGKLHKTIYYKANSGKPFKYEIFQSNDGNSVTATVSTLDEVVKGAKLWTWVVIDPEIILFSDGKHPDFADQEAMQHFRNHYITE